MIRNKVIFWISSILTAVILISMSYLYFVYREENIENLNISIIAYGDDADRWINIKNGAEQAAELYKNKYNVELNLVTASNHAGSGEQMALLEREIANGCNAVMIAANDSSYVSEYMMNRKVEIPMVFIETGIEDESSYSTITANNYDMGCLLGDSIIKREDPQIKVAIIKDSMKRDSVASRFNGIDNRLDARNIKTVVWERNENEKDIDTIYFLQRALVEEAVDVIVALDNESTEAIADAVTNLNKKVKLYGIANSDKAVGYLDKNIVHLLVYENEFNIGYLAVQELISKDKEDFSSYMEYRSITKDDMYSDNNEKLIFPFVK